MEFKDYYAILGVAPDADDKAIKAAYRKLARQYHPDVSEHADAEDRFKEVAEAYEILHKGSKRAEYDELRASYRAQQDSRGRNTGTGRADSADAEADFDAFFRSVFGSDGGRGAYWDQTSSFGGRRGNDDPFAHRGQDIEMELPVFLEETLRETAKPVRFTYAYHDDQGRLREAARSINVKVPAGVTDGSRIRLKGQGGPGAGDAPAGDLYLHIRLVPHPLFDVEGHNLLITVPVAPWEAALGAGITVPTLTGRIQLTVPAGSQSGQKMRIKGKGLPGKHRQGDLFAVLNVVMPKTTDPSLKDLWSELAKKSDFDPRAEWSR
jgi:curved DNA-binding protein